MNGPHELRSRQSAPGWRLVALLALSLVLLGSLAGNAFSVHLGMDMSSSVADVTLVESPSNAVAAEGAKVAEPDTHLVTQAAGPTMPTSPDAQHLMHLVGACLALLAAAVAMLLLLPRYLAHHLDASALPSYRVRLLTTTTWVPPALDPPTSSPVIRT